MYQLLGAKTGNSEGLVYLNGPPGFMRHHSSRFGKKAHSRSNVLAGFFPGGFRNSGRIIGIMLTLALSSLVIATAAIYMLYSTAMEETRERLAESAGNQASLIEAVARFDARFSSRDHPNGSWGATYSQILDAMSIGALPEDSGRGHMEIIREKNGGLFLVGRLEQGRESEKEIRSSSGLGMSARKALQGEQAIYTGPGATGTPVLMAIHPVQRMDIAVAISMDLNHVRNPFLNAAAWVGGITLFLVMLCSGLVYWMSAPLRKTPPEEASESDAPGGVPPVAGSQSWSMDAPVGAQHPASAAEGITPILHRLLSDCLPHGDVGIKQVAPRLGMSPRVLQRKLKDEGLTYSQILLKSRKIQCLNYFSQGKLTLEQIAMELGYSNAGNFNRAFKRETGMTPAEYRRRYRVTHPAPLTGEGYAPDSGSASKLAPGFTRAN